MDNHIQGVNDKISEVFGSGKQKNIDPQTGLLHKLTTYVPTEKKESLLNALFASGAGSIGNYAECSFSQSGIGTYKGNENSNPQYGNKLERHEEKEEMIHVIVESHNLGKVLNTLKQYHPYEEVAYEVVPIKNEHPLVGMGMVGDLEAPMLAQEFLEQVKSIFKTPVLRHSELLSNPIKKVAALGGSGAFAIKNAKAAGADIFLTADLKYHDFFQAENQIVIADIGHFESEQYTKNLLVDFLTKKIPNFAVNLSETKTNPVNYF